MCHNVSNSRDVQELNREEKEMNKEVWFVHESEGYNFTTTFLLQINKGWYFTQKLLGRDRYEIAAYIMAARWHDPDNVIINNFTYKLPKERLHIISTKKKEGHLVLYSWDSNITDIYYAEEE